jgi:hypothetical protein
VIGLATYGRPSWQQQVAGLLVAFLNVSGGSAPRREAEARLVRYGATWEDTASVVFGGVCAGVLAEVRAPYEEPMLVLTEVASP